MNNYSYDQYLAQWEDHFGSDSHGQFVYWHYGHKKSRLLPKMDQPTFEKTLARFDEISPQIDALQKRADYANNSEIGQKVDRMLAESFQYELPLFF